LADHNQRLLKLQKSCNRGVFAEVAGRLARESRARWAGHNCPSCKKAENCGRRHARHWHL